jgi:DNA-binding NtrC family response regulator
MKRNALVLLVAPDALTRRLTANGLEMYGYEIVTARDGSEAMALLQSERRIGIVVTEVDLGGDIDGLAVAEAARQIDSRMLVIYTSRFPHTIPAKRKVSAAPTLRAPYHPQQVIGIISQFRQASANGETAAAAA